MQHSVCVCVCVVDREENRVFARRTLVVVMSMDGCPVPNKPYRWFLWTLSAMFTYCFGWLCILPVTVTVWLVSLNNFWHLIDVTPIKKCLTWSLLLTAIHSSPTIYNAVLLIITLFVLVCSSSLWNIPSSCFTKTTAPRQHLKDSNERGYDILLALDERNRSALASLSFLEL